MLLKTFLKKLEIMPASVRHDSYENKDILEFEKKDGYFPYIEFQSQPKNKKQQIYFDVLNWSFNASEKYVSKAFQNTQDFMKIVYLDGTNQLSIIDQINTRLHAFYMLFKT